MSGSSRSMILGAMVFYPGGEHLTGWRLPHGQPDRYLDVDYFVDLAKTAERGGFSTLFLADELYVWDRFEAGIENVVNSRLEPFTLLGALSQATKHIGLAATVSTTYNEPFHAARRLASLDYMSHGRVAWNLVTSMTDEEARNFGSDSNLDHSDRYRRGREFVDVVKGLWDSWDDDAFVYNKETGQFSDRSKLHTLNHTGEFFNVRGPLNIARPIQGYPVLFQAGASEAGRELAGATAEAVFTLSPDHLAEAQTLYADYKARARESGRKPESLKVMPAFSPVIGETEQAAHEYLELIESLTPSRVALDLLSHNLGQDMSDRDLDAPFSFDFDLENFNQSKSIYAEIAALVRGRSVTLRDVYRESLRRRFLVGTPKTIADWLENRYTNGAADGFMTMFPDLPNSLALFVDSVIPELERRGIYNREYKGTTLREHLGLERPASQYSAERSLDYQATIRPRG